MNNESAASWLGCLGALSLCTVGKDCRHRSAATSCAIDIALGVELATLLPLLPLRRTVELAFRMQNALRRLDWFNHVDVRPCVYWYRYMYPIRVLYSKFIQLGYRCAPRTIMRSSYHNIVRGPRYTNARAVDCVAPPLGGGVRPLQSGRSDESRPLPKVVQA